MKKYLLLIPYIIFLQSLSKTGYFCVPVADLFAKPLYSKHTTHHPFHAVSPHAGQYSCPRIHQGIFNEKVKIIQEHGTELQIGIYNCFYESAFSLERQVLYWTDKKNIITTQELQHENVDLGIFPQPIKPYKDLCQENIITLILPWQSKKTENYYSVGTRFIHAPDLDIHGSYGIVFYDYKSKAFCSETIPHARAIKNRCNVSFHERKVLFVNILKSWVHFLGEENHIPYVWGGVSWCHIYSNEFELIKSTWQTHSIEYWIRPEKHSPCTGFDCSGLILRAAQIAGLPYYFKNTTTISHHLREVKNYKDIENGDIIWCPGHVMIITDLDANTFIEARGYQSGAGKVLEATLQERFGFDSYKSFFSACQQQIPLKPNDSNRAKYYKILSLSQHA